MHNKRNKWLNVFVCALMLTFMFSMVAYADDAVMDILDQPRFGGAVQWVNRIGKIVDNWFMAVISFVSFFIISASCLRNVLAGAYCVFPKFWDKVHEAHSVTDQVSISSAMAGFKGATNWTSGSITTFLMGLLPDIKVLTDFENAEKDSIDYKQYFMKAIPQCVVAVFVGVFIYNGLYRDVMSVTSRFGVAVVDNGLKSVKPDVILEQMTNITVNIDYPTKNAKRGTDYIANVWFESVIGRATDTYSDSYKKENKKKMYYGIDAWAQQEFASAFAEYSDTERWVPSVDEQGTYVYTTALPDNISLGVTEVPGTETTKVFRVVCDVHQLVVDGKVDTAETEQLCYLVGYIALKDNGFSGGANGVSAVTDMTLVVSLPSGLTGGGTMFPTDGVTFSPAGGNVYLNGTGVFTYGGAQFEFKQDTTSGNGSITIKLSGSGNIAMGDTLMGSGNVPTYGGHRVSRIRFIDGGAGAVQAQMQCMFQNGNPTVFGSYGADLSQKIASAQRSQAAANAQAGGSAAGASGNSGESDDDSDLEDVD